MRVIGLTGSIACGKTTVSNYLVSRGFPVVDGDKLSRELTAAGSPVLAEIGQVFGSRFLNENGSLNRRALGRLVFENDQARAKLDELMAPHLLRLTNESITACRKSGSSLCFLDMPLLFEKGYDRLCDSVWSVWLPENIQLQRLMERDGFTHEEALRRIRAVLSSDEKASRADRVINNTGTVQQTLAFIEQLLQDELSPSPSVRSGSPLPAALAGNAPPSGRPVVSSPFIPSGTVPPEAYPVHPEPRISRFEDPGSSAEKPDGMARPPAARRRPSERKVAWRLPVWIRNSLIILTVLLLVGITAYSLMSGYLYRQQEKHADEQKAIDDYYFLPDKYRPMIESIAEEYNLNPAFVASVIRNESSFQPAAESAVGARGLMQLMPDTAEWIAGKLGIRDYAFARMLDPESNIRFGCWYLNYLSRLFNGNPVCVISAYHAGQGQVKIWLSDPSISDDGRTILPDRLPDGPTKNYVGKVTRDYGIYQEKYFSPDQPDSDDSSPVPDVH